MSHRPLRLTRWSTRRSVLGVALVLHLVWLALAAAPMASAHEPAAAAMPCHEAMMHDAMNHEAMTMGDMTMADQHSSPAPLKPAPTHMPCCTQNCACAAGLCAVAAATPHGTLVPGMYRVSFSSFLVLPSREPTPELRPPILH